MGGSNPYIDEVKYKPATQKYKVTFLPSGKTVEVDPEKIPYGHNGIPGSILDISEGFKMGLDHACGGVCACSTLPRICEAGPRILQRSHGCGTRRVGRSTRHHAKVAPRLPDCLDGTTDIVVNPGGIRTTPREPTTKNSETVSTLEEHQTCRQVLIGTTWKTSPSR